MGEFSEFIKNKKNVATLLFMGILMLAIPLGLNYRQQQIIKSRAAEDPLKFTGENVEKKTDGTWIAKMPQISLQLTSPLGPPSGPVASLAPTTSPGQTTTPTASPSSPGQTVAPTPDTTAPSSTVSLNPSTGFTNGQSVTITFNAVDQGGSGVNIVHTSIWPGITNASQKTGSGNYQGVKPGGTRTATVPFYIEYLASDYAKNDETPHTLFVIPTPDTTAPNSTVSLNPSTGFTNGQSVTITFNAVDQGGSGVNIIHTSIWPGITNASQKTGSGNYQGVKSGGTRTATVPFYIEYLASDYAKNDERPTHSLFVTP